MKFLAILLLLSIFAFVSCTPTIKPVENAKPIISNSKLAEGKNIFTTSCAKCHGLPDTNDYNDTEWIDWVQKMAVRAKLDANQEKLVYEYVISQN